METRLAMLAAAERPGVRVSDLCRELGISRETFYKLRRRFRDEGPEGLAARSRRPRRSPNATPGWLEDEICRLRKELPLDNGAQTIAYHLARQGIVPLPSVRTIHRVLVRRGMVVPQPDKRPRSSWRRFEFDAPNECWQIDATEWPLTPDGVSAWIMDVIDDHSRLAVASRVGTGPTVALAWDAFQAGAARWGLPARVLSDNGTCFTGGPTTSGSVFAASLAALGVHAITSRPYHPQTCGKVERYHQSAKRWLATQRRAPSANRLQAQLDRFRAFYNHDRPHKALNGATPAEHWNATPRAVPLGVAPAEPPPTMLIATRRVQADGTITIGNSHVTSVGSEWAGKDLTVIRYGARAVIIDGTTPVRALTIEPTTRYQPSGRRRGGPRRRPT